MKKYIWIGLLCYCFTIVSAIAQDSELFRFVNVAETSGTNKVLHHNLQDNSVNVIPISNTVFNARDGYLQAFILKRLSPGKVLIASAKKNNHFLHYDDSTSQISFIPITDENALDAYTWQINYARLAAVITPLNDPNKGLTIDSNNSISIQNLQNNSRGLITENNVVGDQHRFTIQRVTNVF
ncbi:hypothetical protein [Aquimarina sp. 2201CG5-10]|uniref:hypothetical protein n=1 Tax=Aquimarina callyspongiae TaxID=3098150 RepID=UPI002AB43A1A|nr:hypothetical protein [Aquimarina sp. 2201CG5-10]MDY8135754.1 hypothetical protein [Aquimarina sp. 2201CG5-10]